MVLRDIGQSAIASELAKLYVESRSSEYLAHNRRIWGEDVQDSELKDLIDNKIAQIRDMRDPKDVLISASRGWSDEDVLLLSKVTPEEFYAIFKGINDRDTLSQCIKTALRFGDAASPGPSGGIARNTRSALQKIASESLLNRRRVEKYGVTI